MQVFLFPIQRKFNRVVDCFAEFGQWRCYHQMLDRQRSVHFENGRFVRVAYLLAVIVGAAKNTVNK